MTATFAAWFYSLNETSPPNVLVQLREYGAARFGLQRRRHEKMNQIKNLLFLILKRALRKYNQNTHSCKNTPVTRRN